VGEMSTVAEIESIFRRELESGELTGLDFDFYEKARKLISRLRSEAEAARGIEAEVKMHELSHLKDTLRRLFLLRLAKALDAGYGLTRRVEIALPREEAEVLSKTLDVVNSILGEEEKTGRQEPPPPPPPRTGAGASRFMLVSFKKPYAKILLPSGETLGPFSQGDVTLLPPEVTRELAAKDVVEVLTELG